MTLKKKIDKNCWETFLLPKFREFESNRNLDSLIKAGLKSIEITANAFFKCFEDGILNSSIESEIEEMMKKLEEN